MSKNEKYEMEDQNNDAVVQESEVDPTVKKLKTIGYIVVGAIVCASALYFYNGMNAAKNEEAMTALSRISSYYDSGDTKKALEGENSIDPQKAEIIKNINNVKLKTLSDAFGIENERHHEAIAAARVSDGGVFAQARPDRPDCPALGDAGTVARSARGAPHEEAAGDGRGEELRLSAAEGRAQWFLFEPWVTNRNSPITRRCRTISSA